MSEPPLVLDAARLTGWGSQPYALSFAPDGATLAVGSGSWYGGGALTLVDVAAGEARQELRFAPTGSGAVEPVEAFPGAAHPLTISGVAFDAGGAHLAACAWASGQDRGPAFVFRVVCGQLRHVATLSLPSDPSLRYRRTPTGVCFARDRLFVRCNAGRVEDVLCSFALPDDVDGATTTDHRTHARVAKIGDTLFTGGGGSLRLAGWAAGEGRFEIFHATSGIVVGPPLRAVPAPGARVTAVLARPDGSLVTGGLDGEIVRWAPDGETWRPVARLRDATEREARCGGPWATYRPASVVGLCALEDGRFFSVDASGEVLEWHGEEVARSHTLPRRGTPRCLAVHPATPRGPTLAVGVKVPEGERRGYVACFSID